jgi:hypothetical protein
LLLLILALLCGLGAAVLRGFQLAYSFDQNTSLIEPGDFWTVSLMTLSMVFGLIVIVYVILRHKKTPPPQPGRPRRLGNVWLSVQLLALAALASASALDLSKGFTTSQVSFICLGFLGFFAVAALFMIANNVNTLPFTSTTGFWLTVPIFWSCLMLIMEFWGYAGNPVRSTYVYGTLATVFCALAVYTVAGFLFDRIKPGRVLLYAGPGVFFATLTLGGALLAPHLGEHLTLTLGGLFRAPPVNSIGEPLLVMNITTMLRFAFIALHLTAVLAAVLYGKFMPPAGRSRPQDEEIHFSRPPAGGAEFDTEQEEEDA